MFRLHGNHEYHAHRARKRLVLGLILIIAGSVFLADRLAIIDTGLVWRFWPVAIGLVGLARIVSARKLTHVVRGAFTILVAFWVYACIEHLFGWTFRTSWPIIVISYGVSIVLRGLLANSRNANQRSAP